MYAPVCYRRFSSLVARSNKSSAILAVRHDQHGRVPSADNSVRYAPQYPAAQAGSPLRAHRNETVLLRLGVFHNLVRGTAFKRLPLHTNLASFLDDGSGALQVLFGGLLSLLHQVVWIGVDLGSRYTTARRTVYTLRVSCRDSMPPPIPSLEVEHPPSVQTCPAG